MACIPEPATQQFPVAENGRRGRHDPEYEPLDTGVFDDDRYWVVEAFYVKADPHDLLMEVRVTNPGPEPATVHVLPHLWFRNTWSWAAEGPPPVLAAAGPDRVDLTDPRLGQWLVDAAPDGASPRVLFCDNATNAAVLYGSVRVRLDRAADPLGMGAPAQVHGPAHRTDESPRRT